MEKIARKHIIELKSFIIPINTKLNFARHILMALESVNTGISVHLLIQMLKYQ